MTIAGNWSSPSAPSGRPPGAAGSSWRPALAAAATAAIVLAAALASMFVVRQHVIAAAKFNFDVRTEHITVQVQRELGVCSQVLLGASGLIAAQSQSMPDVAPSSEAWDRYVAHLDLDSFPPCVRTLDYAVASSTAFATTNAGAVGPASEPLAHTVLMWPRHADPADKYDFNASAMTRTALLRAADTSQPTLTVRAVSSETQAERSDNSTRTRIDLYVPVYRDSTPPRQPAARRAALAGFVFARLDAEYLFASIAAHEPNIDMRAAAGMPAMAIFPPRTSSAERSGDVPRFHRTDAVQFGGQTFTIDYSSNAPNFTAAADFSGTAILVAGLLTALVASIAAFMLERSRGTTLAAFGVARSRLSANEARMMAIIRSSSEAIITIDESHHIVIFNPMAEQVFGCSATDAIGSPIERFIPARFRDAYRRDIEQFGQTSVVDLQMGRQRVIYGVRDSGEEFPIEASISQILDGNAKLYTVMLRDVTKRTAVEEELKRSRKELRDLSANLQIVREEEKTRIARELHDDLGQQLTALKMDLSSVEQALEGIEQTPPRVLSQLNGMRRLIDTTVGSVRRIAADLRPVMLDDLGLMPAIEWLINDFTTRYGIEVERRIDLCEVLFSRNGATTIFRIMQEALTNVVRHAEATHVTIAIAIEDEQCLMRIADNGRGASAAADAAGHEAKFGLLGIRERAHILGGEVSIETKSRQGFAITVALPLAAIQQEEALP